MTNISVLKKTSIQIQKLDTSYPEIFYIDSQKEHTKGIIVISPGLCTRELHLVEPFVGYELAKLGYKVYSINNLELGKYNLDSNDPFERLKLTEKAYETILKLHPGEKIISYGHSLGCIDLLRTQPTNIKGCVFVSPGFKGDKKKFSIASFVNFIKGLFSDKDVELFSGAMKPRPELDKYRSNSISARFIWNLQKYAHGLENTHIWPQNLPTLVWFGSDQDSDGIMEMKQPKEWAESIQTKNDKSQVIINPKAGHEPGWKNPEDAKKLATEIDGWIEEYIL